MKKRNTDRYYIEETKNLISLLYQSGGQTQYRICSSKMMWKIMNQVIVGMALEKVHTILGKQMAGKKIIQIIARNMQKIEVNDEVTQIIGSYEIVFDNKFKNFKYDILVTYLSEKAVYVQISKIDNMITVKHAIKTTNESIHSLEENEILYIESQHNHVIWHCMDKKISSNDSLHHLEEILSEKFVRIQRGYLVNKCHVKCIQRCEAVMRNGDVLPIPCKKYILVRELLMK